MDPSGVEFTGKRGPCIAELRGCLICGLIFAFINCALIAVIGLICGNDEGANGACAVPINLGFCADGLDGVTTMKILKGDESE